MTRALPASYEDAPGILPPADERLDLADAIAAYTINGAHIMRMEDEIGSLEVGKLADLIVLDQNLFDIDPTEIHATQVLLTMMGGKPWHDVILGWGDANIATVPDVDLSFEGMTREADSSE